MAGQPLGGGSGQGLQRGPQGLCDHLQPVEIPDRGDHVRGVGTLLAAGFEQSEFHQAVQQHLEGHALQPVVDQAGAKLRQDREIEAGVGQLKAQRVLPVDPPAHRVGGLAVGKVLGELQHGDHRELSRRDPRAPSRGKRIHERPIAEHLAQLITDPHRQRPSRKRRPGHRHRLRRNLRKRTRAHRHHRPRLVEDNERPTSTPSPPILVDHLTNHDRG